jgi:molybdopterin-guanine dinucleotide biosynthesis protein A
VINEIENIFKLSEKDKSIKGSVYELLEREPIELIDVDDLYIYNKNIFLNMNSPEDYKLIKNIYENH